MGLGWTPGLGGSINQNLFIASVSAGSKNLAVLSVVTVVALSAGVPAVAAACVCLPIC